jgi:ferrochelatase
LITPFRAGKSAHAYKSIWTEDGSPLIVLTKELKEALDGKLDMPVTIAMRYGNPTPKAAFDEIKQNYPSVKEVILLPLYPHYAMSSYETAVAYAQEIYSKEKYSFRLEVIKPFYNNELYINALSKSIEPYLSEGYDHVLFSYHGIPERHILKADVTNSHCLKSPDCCTTPSPAHNQCYRHQCFMTTKLAARELNIADDHHSVSFQSRLGRSEWLKPYTVQMLQDLPAKGVKKLVIVCPAFISDCLETLEEIAVEGRDIFLKAGGESFTLVPCLNVHPLWVQTIATWMDEINEGYKKMLL